MSSLIRGLKNIFYNSVMIYFPSRRLSCFPSTSFRFLSKASRSDGLLPSHFFYSPFPRVCELSLNECQNNVL